MIKAVTFLGFLFTQLLLFVQCDTTEPPDNNNDQDTTSHNFSFQTCTFGEHSSSVLYDVAIINENNIWAVGEIYMNDSLGQPDPNAFNAAHWDGSEWKLKRIRYYGSCSAVEYPPLIAIWALSENELVISNGGSIGWLTGNTLRLDCEINPLLTGSINKVWGSNKDDLYVVGNNGNIVRYQNGSWTNIVSGTDLDVYDIWGDYNSTNSGYEIIAVAAKEFVTFNRRIFRITGNSAQNISSDSIPFSIHGVWFKSGKKYLVAGDGLYSKNNINSTSEWEWLHPAVTYYYLYAIRGQDINDIFTCGAFGEMIHYKGSTWKSFMQETSINGTLNNIDFKKNLVAAVGYASPKAVITIGKR
jgi:hypothetical protein